MIWRRLTVTPKLTVLRYAVPACKGEYPDYKPARPERPLPCYVNFGAGEATKKRPVYYVTNNGERHYVKRAD